MIAWGCKLVLDGFLFEVLNWWFGDVIVQSPDCCLKPIVLANECRRNRSVFAAAIRSNLIPQLDSLC